MPRRRVRRPLVALVALVAALAVGYGVRGVRSDHSTRSPSTTASTTLRSAETPLSALPEQVAQTVQLIERGGPFPYPHNDGVVFHNAEHHLPDKPNGYYREYTVPTPGASTRGARRIITGADGEYYYTGDHYESFVRVDVTK